MTIGLVKILCNVYYLLIHIERVFKIKFEKLDSLYVY